jgi:hypothetical protein
VARPERTRARGSWHSAPSLLGPANALKQTACSARSGRVPSLHSSFFGLRLSQRAATQTPAGATRSRDGAQRRAWSTPVRNARRKLSTNQLFESSGLTPKFSCKRSANQPHGALAPAAKEFSSHSTLMNSQLALGSCND